MDNTISKNNFKILQWNANSLKPKLKELELVLKQEKVHIATVSETWLSNNVNINVSSYNIFRQDRDDSYGGLCVIAHKSVKLIQKPCSIPYSDIEILMLEVLNVPYIRNIVSIYCPPTANDDQQSWDYIFSLANTETLILGDMNAHHCLWSNRSDGRGQLVYRTMFENDFMCLNDGSMTRIKLVNGILQKSAPDITFASVDIAHRLSWSVTNETLRSDHIMIEIKLGYDTPNRYNKKRNFKKAQWDNYTQKIEDIFCDLPNSPDVQSDYDKFIEKIDSVAESTIPWTKISQDPTSKFDPKPYWNTSLSKAVAERRLSLAQLRRNPTPENYIKYKEKTAKAKRLIESSASQGWTTFCTEIDSETSPTVLWRKMRWLKGGRSSNRPTITDSKAAELLQALTPDTVQEQAPHFSEDPLSTIEGEITIQEMENSLKRKDTSPGSDNVSYSMLYNLSVSAKVFLLNIYNRILQTGIVPKQWRDITVIPVPKPGRDALRPISLMSCPCKLFHLITMKRLEWYVESKQLLSYSTVGFRRKKSCLDGLGKMVSSIQTGFMKNAPTIAVFLDIEDAYNNVNISHLVATLQCIGVGNKICNYLWNFLSERLCTITDSCNNTITRCARRGLAQGDPLSPLLFNVVTMEVIEHLNNVNVSQYADDFALYITVNNKNIDAAVSDIEEDLESITTSLGFIGLNLSETKTSVCVFNRSHKKINVAIDINGKKITTVDKVKYLGFWLDRSLRWGTHINGICEKGYKYINILKVLAGSTWGVHPKHLCNLYMSLIRSRIDYGSFLYDNAAKTHLKKLDVLQNKALRVCGGFIRSTPVHVMESELSLPPLCIRRLWLGCRYWLKVASTPNDEVENLINTLSRDSSYWNNKKKPLLAIIHSKFHNIDIFKSGSILDIFSLDIWLASMDVSYIEPNIKDLDKSKRETNNCELRSLSLHYLEKDYSGYYKIFTDASKTSSGIGAALFDSQTGTVKRWRLNGDICIMRAELIAIAEAIKYAADLPQLNIVILTDARSALQHLARCTSDSRGMPIAYQILGMVLNVPKNIKMQWVPSHVGVHGNEVADSAAREAVEVGEEVLCPPYVSEQIATIRTHCYNEWKKYFDDCSETKGIWYRTIQNSPKLVTWFGGARISREHLVYAFRVRSGHVPVNKFLLLMRAIYSDSCKFCGKTEDLLHVLLECDQYTALRAKFLRGLPLCNGMLNITLSDPLSHGAKSIYLFLRAAMLHRS